MIKAVLDQIIGGSYAVLLMGEEKAQFLVPVKKLPPDVTEGDWFNIELSDEGVLLSVELLDEEELMSFLFSKDNEPQLTHRA